jgi:hypothetical protein
MTDNTVSAISDAAEIPTDCHIHPLRSTSASLRPQPMQQQEQKKEEVSF